MPASWITKPVAHDLDDLVQNFGKGKSRRVVIEIDHLMMAKRRGAVRRKPEFEMKSVASGRVRLHHTGLEHQIEINI